MMLFLILFFATACTLEPSYQTPSSPVDLEPCVDCDISVDWKDFYNTTPLQTLINTALLNNKDLKISYLAIEEARATYDIQKANLLPSVNASFSATKQGVPNAFSRFLPTSQYRSGVNLVSYELDFFGRLRSLKKSAYENYLATEESRLVLQNSLIAEVVSAYIRYLLDRDLLLISQDYYNLTKQKMELMQKLAHNGLISDAELQIIYIEYSNSMIFLEFYKKEIEQDSARLMLLMGGFDVSKIPLISLRELYLNEKSIESLSSVILLNRPDIKAAEHYLRSANADIGAARAAFFPSISLAGTYGDSSRDLSSLFASRFWSFSPQVNLPIFRGGLNKANLDLANIRKDIRIVAYEKAIQNAFKESLDALANYQFTKNKLRLSDDILNLSDKNLKIKQIRHQVGIDSKIELIDSHLNNLIKAQESLTTRADYLISLVELYKVFTAVRITPEDESLS